MTELEKIATDCRDVAAYYQDNPGLTGAQTMIDLYLTVKRLAEATDRIANATIVRVGHD